VLLSVPLNFDNGELRTVCPRIEKQWRDLIREILRRRFVVEADEYTLLCTPEAREVFRAFHNETIAWRQGALADFGIELSRWRENALRLCVGQAVAENPNSAEITEDIAKRVVDRFRWIGFAGLELFAQGREDRLQTRADKLEGALVKAGGEITVRDLERRNNFDKREIAQLIEIYPLRFREEDRKTASKHARFIVLIQNAES